MSTNFGYGSASYFNLTVVYKGIVIAPYSYLVKYYIANMVELCKFTRAYLVDRDNWKLAFDFVVDFVNQGRTDPENFAKNYIMNEVREMVSGLKRIMQSPTSELQKMLSDMNRYSLEIKTIDFIYNMPNEDKDHFELNRSEFSVVYKAEKISSGLDLLESLSNILSILPDVQNAIDDIKNMNYLVLPEIEPVVSIIRDEVNILQTKVKRFDEQIAEIYVLLLPLTEKYNSVLKEKRTESDFDFNTFQKEFNHGNPDYPFLQSKFQQFSSERNTLSLKLRDRQSVLDRLERCVKKINFHLTGAA